MASSHSASISVAHQICDHVCAHMKIGASESVRVIGITGPPGTGKSTVSGLLADFLAARGVSVAGVLSLDGFHLSNAVLSDLVRAQRKGAPDTFDIDGYVSLLTRARKAHRTIYAPIYSREIHEPIAAGTALLPHGVIITEGNYLALSEGGWEQVRPLIDMMTYIDTDEIELLRRLVARHEIFGRDPISAGHWVRTVDLPNIRRVAHSRFSADYIVSASQTHE